MKNYERRRVGVLCKMGVLPWEQGRLYWFQEKNLMDQHVEDMKFQAQLGGAKIK